MLKRCCLVVLSVVSSYGSLAQVSVDLYDPRTGVGGTIVIPGRGQPPTIVVPGPPVAVPERPRDRDHGHRPGPQRPPMPPAWEDDIADSREAALLLRSCGSSVYAESQVRCFRDSLGDHPNRSFRSLSRACQTGTYYSDQSNCYKAGLERAARSERSSVMIQSACSAMVYSEGQAKCFASALDGRGEDSLRTGCLKGTYYSDQANCFKAGVARRNERGGELSSLNSGCSAMVYSEGQAKCLTAGGRATNDWELSVVIAAATQGTYYSDQANAAKAGLGARIAQRSLQRQIQATCSAMVYSEGKAKCFQKGIELSGDPTLQRLARGCSRASYYSEIASCYERLLRDF